MQVEELDGVYRDADDPSPPHPSSIALRDSSSSLLSSSTDSSPPPHSNNNARKSVSISISRELPPRSKSLLAFSDGPPPFSRTKTTLDLGSVRLNPVRVSSTITLKPTKKNVIFSCLWLVLELFLLSLLPLIFNIPISILAGASITGMKSKASGVVGEILLLVLMYFLPFVYLIAIYSWDKAKFLVAINATVTPALILLGLLMYFLLPSLGEIIPYFLLIAVLLIHTYAFGKKMFKAVIWFAAVFALPSVMCVVFILINDYTIIPFFMTTENTALRIVIRQVIQPAFYTVLVLFLRWAAKQLNSERCAVFTIFPLFFKAFFGRFFNAEFYDYDIITLNSFISAGVDIALRISRQHRSDVISLFLRYLPDSWEKSRPMTLLMGRPAGDEVFAQFLNYEKSMEVQCIIIAQTVQIVYVILNSDSNGVAHLFGSMFIQLAIEVTAQFICTLLEYKYDIPTLSATKNYMEFVPIFIYTSVVAAIFCIPREFRVTIGVWNIT